MALILKSLQLSDEALIERWKRLVEHVRELPPRPSGWVFRSSLTEITVTAVRAARQPHMVFINVMNDEDLADLDTEADAELLLERGIVVREYKIDLKTPFIMSTIEVVNTADATRRWQALHTLVEAVRRVRLMASTDLLTPTVEELDSVLRCLDEGDAVPLVSDTEH